MRLRIRVPGADLKRALGLASELDGILEQTGVEDFVVDNGPGRTIGDVAGEVLPRAAWL